MRPGPTSRHPHTFSACLSWLIVCALMAIAPPVARAERLPIRVYTSADGLPHDRISQIVRDSHGFLWFCTAAGGLSRFDGARFTTYSRAEDFPHHSINGILEDTDGTYWIATNGGGVYHFDLHPRRDRRRPGLAAMAVGDEPATSRVNDVYRDRSGNLWAGTDAGIFVLKPTSTSFRRISRDTAERPDSLPQVWKFYEDRDGTLWIGSSDGLWLRRRDGRIARYSVRPEHGVDNVLSLLEDDTGQMWIGHQSGVILLTRSPESHEGRPARARKQSLDSLGRVRWYGAAEGMPTGTFPVLFKTADAHLWIGSTTGLTEFDGNQFRRYGPKEGLSLTPIRTLAEDGDGNLWAGTDRGVMRIARHGLTTYTEDDGLASLRVGSIFETRAEEICAVSIGQFINVFDGRRFHAVRPKLPPPAGDYAMAAQDKSGDWWIPVGDRLYRFAAVTPLERLAGAAPKAIYTSRDGLPDGEIWRMFEDSRGDLWYSTRARRRDMLARWDHATGTFYRYSDRDGLPPFNAAASFAEDRAGNVWFGFWDGGIARYRNGRFLTFADESTTGWRGSLIQIDEQGRLWASTSTGVSWIDDPTAERPQLVKRPLPLLDEVWPAPLVVDGRGGLFFTIRPGIARFEPETGQITRYTRADGLAQLEPITAFRDRAGAVWFGTAQGISRLRPGTDRRLDPPMAAIGGVRIAGEPYPITDLGQTHVGGLELPSDQRELAIDFFAISFRVGELIQYEYKLEGAERDWSRPTDDRTVNYARLAPGSYRFLVRAVNGSGVRTQPATLAFTVLAPVWQRPWFVALAFGLVAGIVYAGFRYRLRRLLELERIRTRIATDLHDDIGASLSQIAILSEVVRRRAGEDEVTIGEPLAHIAATARELVDSMSDIVWAIDPHKDRFASLAKRMRRLGSDILPAKDITFACEIQGEEEGRWISADTRRQVFLIFKEGINNIVRHARATAVSVVLRQEGGTLTLVIADNGCGFDPASSTDGHGLKSMRDRASRLGGMLDVRSAVGAGTRLTLTCHVGGVRPPK
ncbi:MAG TPA: two-component regulator propeller domain-containing protein [Vicinamibacterales bacterium]|nr:two-component regulator propeller domain-containing protein [Vicinamibacterales bacterium]